MCLSQRPSTRPVIPRSVAAILILTFSLCFQFAVAPPSEARPAQSFDSAVAMVPAWDRETADPVYESRLHYVNRVWCALTNWGLLGTEGENRVAAKDRYPLGIDYSPSFEYPAGTRTDYLYGGSVWIGGIIGTDTLVSLAMNGESAPRDEWNAYDTVAESSSEPASQYYHPDARADQQYFVRVYDTLVLHSTDELDIRPHLPLNLEVSQTSYAWADQALRDFVIVEYWIRNIGILPIDKMVFGAFIDADVFSKNQSPPDPFSDDVSGFVEAIANPLNPSIDEPINVAWIADNNGDPVNGAFNPFSPTAAIGMRMLRTPPVEDISFNWWTIGGTAAQEWGPVMTGARAPAPGGGLGSPLGDRNCYYVMSNHEIDYDQFTANLDHTGDGWRPRLRAGGCDIADGLDARCLLTAGPACNSLFPGDSVPFVMAFFGGQDLHTGPQNPFDCFSPTEFIAGLDFSGLACAARWAAWLYDTPGLDTDADGYRGEYSLENSDTVFYTGDLGATPYSDGNCATWAAGGPDFMVPAAPPCPEILLEPRFTGLAVLWDGRASETVKDAHIQRPDFKGYRLYLSPSGSPGSYSLIASWDIDDDLVPVSDFGTPETVIHRIRTDSIVTGDGQIVTYGVYEAVLTGLNPASGIFVSVTSFDQGFEELRLDPTESPVGGCYAFAAPMGEQFGETLIDIAPGQCPNWLTTCSSPPLGRVVPTYPSEQPATELTVAILGRDALDINEIVVSSVQLENCPSIGHSFADVSSPVVRDATCDCWIEGSDGWMDLVLKFNKAQVIEQLGAVAAGDQVNLTVTAEFTDGSQFTGSDCVTIGSLSLSPAPANAAGHARGAPQCYPNPFNSETTISYEMVGAGPVTVEIFDILGRRVWKLLDEVVSDGPQTISWKGIDDHGNPLSSGTYLCRLRLSGDETTLKLLLIK